MTGREARARLAEVGRRFDARGWVSGTSGNFSVVRETRPLRLVMTASSVHKGRLTSGNFVEVDSKGRGRARRAQPSAEALLHLQVVATRHAGAVLHTHSIWSTILSDRHFAAGGLPIEGYEMLKGLAAVATHAHREWLPILDNSQDMSELSARVEAALAEHPSAHGFLLRRHGLYTWGASLDDAVRHVEILEFLLEAVGRSESPSRH